MPADKQAIYDLCDVDDHIKEYKRLQKYNFKVEAKFAKLLAPNEYENISFDDFVMFARSCVELATYLFNSISYDYEKIILDAPVPKYLSGKNIRDNGAKGLSWHT